QPLLHTRGHGTLAGAETSFVAGEDQDRGLETAHRKFSGSGSSALQPRQWSTRTEEGKAGDGLEGPVVRHQDGDVQPLPTLEPEQRRGAEPTDESAVRDVQDTEPHALLAGELARDRAEDVRRAHRPALRTQVVAHRGPGDPDVRELPEREHALLAL